MNYLAHAYLSFNQPDILAGNLISDFVKGKKKFTYSQGIQNGMALHRAIDRFTDDHPATIAAKLFFKPTYRLYSGAFVDVVYDHFLATDSNEFIPDGGLQTFSSRVYKTLTTKFSELPENFQKIFPYMEKQNWLCNYQHTWGVNQGFCGLVNRAAYLHEHSIAFSIFITHYYELESCYKNFFPQLKQFAGAQLSNLLRNDSIYT